MWWPLSGVSDQQMVAHAAHRGQVRLASGGVFRLVSWPVARDQVSGRRCRLETFQGGRFAVNTRYVADRWLDDV